jgi:excisionase family DNA binding protein
MPQTYATPTTEPLLRKRDVERILGISTRSLERLVTDGRLHPVRVGSRTIRFLRADIDDFIERSREERAP